MASPQLEDGFTRISNELLEKVISTQFIATHIKIILVCWRYTYGFSRKEAQLSESFISKATGISKRYIAKEMKTLIESKIIKVVRESTFTSSRIVSFNKNFDEWEYRTIVQQMNNESTGESQNNTTVEPEFNTTVEPQFHQERNNIKKNINKDICELLFEKFWKEYPRKVGKGDSFKCWKARIKEKCKPEDMIQAATNYTLECGRKNTEPEYIKHPKTFLSKTKPFEDYIKTNDIHSDKTEEKRNDIIKAPAWFVEKAGGISE